MACDETDGQLQDTAIEWGKIAWLPVVFGLVLISMAAPWISETVRLRWFTLPALIAVASIPITTGVALLSVRVLLNSEAVRGRLCWVPFAWLVLVLFLSFLGLGYSIYPFVVIDRLTVWKAASSPESLQIILIRVCVTLPAIIGYTGFYYRVFRGKAIELDYA